MNLHRAHRVAIALIIDWHWHKNSRLLTAIKYLPRQAVLPMIDKAWFYFLKGHRTEAEAIIEQYKLALDKEDAFMVIIFMTQITVHLQVNLFWAKGEYVEALQFIEKSEKTIADIWVGVVLTDLLHYIREDFVQTQSYH